MKPNQLRSPFFLFTVQAATQIYSPERIQREIGPGMTQLLMVIGDKDLEEANLVTTCCAMWIPNQYAPLCLEDELSPVDVWNRVYGAMLQNGHTTVCSPPVHYLQYKLQGTVLGNTAIFDAQDLHKPPVTSDFLCHGSSVLSHMMGPASSLNNGPQAPAGGGAFGMSP